MMEAYRKSPYRASTNIALNAIFSFLVLAIQKADGLNSLRQSRIEMRNNFQKGPTQKIRLGAPFDVLEMVIYASKCL